MIIEHIAFSVGSRGKVDELAELLDADGYEVVSDPRAISYERKSAPTWGKI